MSHSYLIVKLSSLGDVIQSYFTAAYLKQIDQNCHISWVVEKRFSKLVKSYSVVDTVFEIDTKKIRKNPLKHIKNILSFLKGFRKAKFDVVFDLQGNTKSAIFTLLAKSRKKVGFSKDSVAEIPNLWVTNHKVSVDRSSCISKQYLQVLKTYFKDDSDTWPKLKALHVKEDQKQAIELFLQQSPLKNAPIFMICPNSNWENKKIPETLLIDFLQGLDERIKPSFLFIFGTVEEKKACDKYKLLFPSNSAVIGALELPVWQYLMTKMICVISMDSSALHLAALSNVPTFSFFGPSSSKVYKPYGKEHVAIQGSCPFNSTFVKRCDKLRTCPNAPCISNFSTKNLLEKFFSFYSEISKSQPSVSTDQSQYETRLKK